MGNDSDRSCGGELRDDFSPHPFGLKAQFLRVLQSLYRGFLRPFVGGSAVKVELLGLCALGSAHLRKFKLAVLLVLDG